MSYNRNRNFDRNNYGGSISRNVDPWDTSNDWSMRGGGNNNMGGGGGGGNNAGGGHFNQNPSNELANHLLNLLRNNNQAPPSLLDLPQADMRGYGYNNRNSGGSGDFDRFDDRRMSHNNNRHNNQGGGNNNHHSNNNHQNNNNRNRRGGGGVAANGPRNHPAQQHMQGKANNVNRNSGGIRKPNSLDRSKKVLAKNSNNSKSNPSAKPDDAAKTNAKAVQSHDDEENEGGANAAESVYVDVPSDMFYCHLCKKHMWDCTSFENHVKGRTHQMMKEGVEESYRMKANMIRQEAKIDEQLKSIEVERLKRMGKAMKNSNVHREYCQMCDLHFYGHLSTHRKSEGHLNLKKFLHPKCPECNEEFQNRIEFDAHLLSREHMLKAASMANRVDVRRNNQLMILTEVDEVKDVREEKVKEPTVATTTTPEGAEGAVAATENGEAGGEAAAADAEEKPEDPDVILDYVEGTTEIGVEIEAKLPIYISTRAIGSSMIAKLECFECKLCSRFFDNEKTAEVHSRTMYHHRQFVKFLTEKATDAKIAQKRAAVAIENENRKRARIEKEAEGEAAAVNPEDTPANGQEAVEAANTTAEVEQATAVATDETPEAPPSKKPKTDLYDPSEATEDTDNDLSIASVPVTPVVAAVKSAPVTPAVATPSPQVQAAQKSGGGSAGTPRGGRGGNRGNRGRGRGRRF